MGVSVAVATAPVESATISRGAPRKLFRGVRRTLIRKTLAKLTSITNNDSRENTRAALLGYNAALITGAKRTSTNNAFATVIARLQAALLAKEGDDF